ncbi:SusC/RagA family TonB-linked outer membrane protein [Mucilaginibacter pocheonensis]|uniref:TonB-linked SusC/RagA family outer membrane protein n=1 Tax=Mucilaginibacter pocheonensis TaxID=398050 RepID=A0ABU1T5M4_9SPHI|nr:TonB-dependent receptor [Mucilaginibacter pocheonensis]MDR6940689.1 TonB-linked SusC/RagA family outer membrane protein [Mucilaginibacter pocheonensis]
MIKIYTPLSPGFMQGISKKRAGISVLLKMACCYLFVLLPFWASAQTVVTGTVKDNKGVPAIGATITEKGLKNSAVTDVNGKFKINLKGKSGVLTISYIGYKAQEVTVGASGDVSVTLAEDLNKLNEVIVVGYSSKQASQLSSSVSVISGNKLRDVTSNNLVGLLQGKAPGVVVSSASGDPSSGASILIRGASSISASTSPLVVVDGNIGGTYNPTDVESVTILKDAAATGLYGSRAANGVIIVTTKMGKSGLTKIDINSVVGFNNATFGNFHLMNSQQLYEYQKTFLNPDPSLLKNNTNWLDLAFRTGITQNHTISASGGSDKTQFYVSGNYYKEQGTLIDNAKTAYNLRSNLVTNLSDKIKLSVLLNTIYTKDNNPTNLFTGNALYDAYLSMPFDPAYNADGTPTDGRTYPGWVGRDKENFLHGLQYNFANAKSLNTSGDFNIDYAITKHLSFATYNRVTLYNYRDETYYDTRTKDGGANSGELYNSNSFSSTLLTSNRLKYDNSFGNHNLSLLVVGEGQKFHYEDQYLNGKGLPAGSPVMSTATDIISNPSGGVDEYNFRKYLGQADYNFAGKYFLVGSYVHEYSSRFGSNNPSGNFYQGGASWILTKEDFMQNVKAINFLKLRVSYGTTGNAEIGNYAALGLYSIDQSASYNGAPGSYPSQKVNPNLTWEKMKTANLGLDFGLFNRIDVNIDVYQKTSSALLFKKPLPATSGYNYVFENIGSVRNRGLEINVNSRNLIGAFKWETNFNIAFNRNKVLSLDAGELTASPGASLPIAVGHDMNDWYMPIWAGVDPANGKPLWQKLVTDANGNVTKQVTSVYSEASASKQFTGSSASPKFTGGITNTFAYKNFSLSTFFNFVYGNQVYNDSRVYFDNDGLYDSYNVMVPLKSWTRWQKPGDIATEPKAIQGGNNNSNATSSRYLENGSYLRLRNVTLGYQLPQSWLNSLKIRTARIFVSGDNLVTFTKFTGVDPEVDLSPSPDNIGNKGISSFKYPISRKILFGVNVGF